MPAPAVAVKVAVQVGRKVLQTHTGQMIAVALVGLILVMTTLPAIMMVAGIASVAGMMGGASSGSTGFSNCGTWSTPSGTALANIPPNYLADYMAAAKLVPGMNWTLLAGIGTVESSNGQNPAAFVPNFAGAVGPMQFLPPTFNAYHVHINGSTVPATFNILSPGDAIATAAMYLHANGAPSNDIAALWAYNHSHSYATWVLSVAATYAKQAGVSAPAGAPAPTITTAPAKSTLTSTLPGRFATPVGTACTSPTAYTSGSYTNGLPGITSKQSQAVIAFASQHLGDSYVLGATGPTTWDCSGLTQASYAAAGIPIQRTSQEQWATMPHVLPSQVQPGDLVFFQGYAPPYPDHVGIVLDPKTMTMIDAPNWGLHVRVESYGPGSGWGPIIGYAGP